MKSILISGYNSYIGNHFLKKYKKKYKIINYKEDINDISKFKLFIKAKKIDFFIHLASLSRMQCDVNKKLCKRTNFLSVKKIINHLNTLKFKPNFIFMSSSHVYTNSSYKIKEGDKKNPASFYGKLKLQSENYLKKNYKKYCILRLFNVYGKNQPYNFFIPDMHKKIKLQKEIRLNKSIRDFIHVNDVVKILNFIIKNNINDTINVGSGYGKLLSSVVKMVSSKNKNKPLVKITNKNDKLIANISKLRSIGYKSKICKINEKNFNI